MVLYNLVHGSDHADNIRLTIPFVNYEFEIDYMLTLNMLNNYPVILNFLQTFYLFIISYYIVNDIRKNIEKIKSGDIMTHTDTNIKADML